MKTRRWKLFIAGGCVTLSGPWIGTGLFNILGEGWLAACILTGIILIIFGITVAYANDYVENP